MCVQKRNDWWWVKIFNIKSCCGALVSALCLCHHCPTVLSLWDSPGLYLAVIPDLLSEPKSVSPPLTLQLWLPDALQQWLHPHEQLHVCLGDHRRLGSHRWSWAGAVFVSAGPDRGRFSKSALRWSKSDPFIHQPQPLPASESDKISNHRVMETWPRKRFVCISAQYFPFMHFIECYLPYILSDYSFKVI